MTGIYRRILERIDEAPTAVLRARRRADAVREDVGHAPQPRRGGAVSDVHRHRGRRWPGRDHGRARLRSRGRRGDARRGPSAARRRRLLVRARRAVARQRPARVPALLRALTDGCWRGSAATATRSSRSASRSRCWRPGRRVAWLRRSALPAPLHLAGSLAALRPPARRPSGSRRLAPCSRCARVDPDDAESEDRSFGAWLRQHGQGDGAIEALWELIARPTLNVRVDDASLAAAAFVFRVGLLERADAGDLGYARTPLAANPRRRGAAGAHGGGRRRAPRVGAPSGSRPPAGGFAVTGSGERLESGAVVLAVPHERVPGAPARRRAAGRRRAGGARRLADRQPPRRLRPPRHRLPVRGRRALARPVRVRPHRVGRPGARAVPGRVAVRRRRRGRTREPTSCARDSCRRSPSCCRPRASRA